MIRNSAEWDREQAPESVQTLFGEVESGGEHLDDLEEGKAYAQSLYNAETGVQQIHVGYYLPELASDFDIDEPFKQEFFIYSHPTDGGRHIQLLYASEPTELFEGSDEYQQTLVVIDELLMENLVTDLSEAGLFEYTSVEDSIA